MGYYIFERARHRPPVPSEDAALTDDAQLAALLEHGTESQRRAVLRLLIERRAEDSLARCLASDDAEASRLAAVGLWECWLGEKGAVARSALEAGIVAMNEGDLGGATAIFQDLMLEFPDWAEALNKQATVFYLQGLPEQSIALCQRVVHMKPDHFGAWNGLALCAIQVENWPLAHEAVRESLRLQPKSGYNQQLLKLVESRLPPA